MWPLQMVSRVFSHMRPPAGLATLEPAKPAIVASIKKNALKTSISTSNACFHEKSIKIAFTFRKIEKKFESLKNLEKI